MTEVATTPALAVEDLRVEFRTPRGVVKAVDGVNLSVAPGQALGILGESGSGKSVTAGAVMGILDSPPAKVTSGHAYLGGDDLLAMAEPARRAVLGERIAMVFQDALTALNPVHPVGRQIAELYRVHRGMSRADATKAAVEMMDQVRIPDAAGRRRDYPHQFSGGMRQRIMIAMALALDPEVLIADEPTTALDVTVQAQILDLLKTLQTERGMALILITHDLAVVSETTDQIVVMYAGRVVESGTAQEVLENPAHPYTRGLARSVAAGSVRGETLPTIPGQPPDLLRLAEGCSFAPRCELVRDKCRTSEPPLVGVEGSTTSRTSACHFSAEVVSR